MKHKNIDLTSEIYYTAAPALNRIYVLCHEPDGYIFRAPDCGAIGHSGHSSTPDVAIQRAERNGSIIYKITI
jgi:hypothetical protein